MPTNSSSTSAPVFKVADYAAGVRAGNRAVVARTLTLVESTRADHRAMAREVLTQLLPHTGRAARVGITGPPGCGKSTFIEALGTRLTSCGRRVAVLAIDPSSSVSGGSILGDKTRMDGLAVDPNAFIRPTATGGTLGGVANRTRESLLVCEAAGYDVVLIETVGVGQSETAVGDLVDYFMTLILPGGGDELQGIKRGLIELVDLVVVNKADGAGKVGAELTASQYRNSLSIVPRPDGSVGCPVLTCSALNDDGVEEVWRTIERRVTAMRANGQLEQRRRLQAERWFELLLTEGLRQRFEAHVTLSHGHRALASAVADGTMLPETAVAHLLALQAVHDESPTTLEKKQ